MLSCYSIAIKIKKCTFIITCYLSNYFPKLESVYICVNLYPKLNNNKMI